MSINGIKIACLLCKRNVADDKIALHITKGILVYNYETPSTGEADFKRFGGKVKPRGIICIECANRILPEEYQIKDIP